MRGEGPDPARLAVPQAGISAGNRPCQRSTPTAPSTGSSSTRSTVRARGHDRLPTANSPASTHWFWVHIPLGHNRKPLTSNFARKLPMGAENSQIRAMGAQLAPGVEPLLMACTKRGVGLGACSTTCAMKVTRVRPGTGNMPQRNRQPVGPRSVIEVRPADRVLADPHTGALALDRAIDQFYTADVFMHTWDLARATGQDDRLDPGFCAQLLAGMEQMEEVIRSSGQYGVRVEVPDDADHRPGCWASSAAIPSGHPQGRRGRERANIRQLGHDRRRAWRASTQPPAQARSRFNK